MLNIYHSADYNKELKKAATTKDTTLRSVEISFLINEHSKYGLKAYGRENCGILRLYGWDLDYCNDKNDIEEKTWFTLREPWVKLPDFLNIWTEHHGPNSLYNDPKLTTPPKDLEFTSFEKKVKEYFDKNNFLFGELSTNNDAVKFKDVLQEYKNDKFKGNFEFFLRKGGSFPFNRNGLIHHVGYTNVTSSLMANFLNYLKDKDINISACEFADYDAPEFTSSFKICFEDFDGPPAKAKELFEAYAEEFGLYRHLINIYFDETEPIEKAPALLGIKIRVSNHTPSKSSAALTPQGTLLDQNGVLIEVGDIIAYPRGGDHNYYCLYYGKVKANTAKMVIMENNSQARHDKVMVIKSKNPDKKLPWDD